MPDDEPAVKVTLTAIYDRVVGVEKQVADLSSTLPAHISITKEKQDEYESRLENHGMRLATLDTRLTIIETRQVPRAPWYSIIGGVVSIITGIGSLLALLAVLGQLAAIQTP